jgi:hypothetical protein
MSLNKITNSWYETEDGQIRIVHVRNGSGRKIWSIQEINAFGTYQVIGAATTLETAIKHLMKGKVVA